MISRVILTIVLSYCRCIVVFVRCPAVVLL